jgi:hypothetical protein
MKDDTYFTRNPNSTIETNPLVIADDTQTSFWYEQHGASGGSLCSATLTDDVATKHEGVNSLKITNTLTNVLWGEFAHDYGAGNLQNWSVYDFLSLWMYGAGSYGWLRIAIMFNVVAWTDYVQNWVLDNTVGWRRIIFPLNTMSIGGTVDWTKVSSIRTTTDQMPAVTWYFDRMILDVFPWVNSAVQTKVQRRGIP